MSTAGFQLVAGRIPGERLATSVETTISASFTTTETVIHTVTAALVTGRTYAVHLHTRILSDVNGDNVDVRIREDNVSGTTLQLIRRDLLSTAIPETLYLYAEYTAVATGNKTFVGTGDRTTGSGNLTRNLDPAVPGYLFVEYISG
jgi:hypothetical protein